MGWLREQLSWHQDFQQRTCGEDGSCPFCHDLQGFWHHMMWECPENPAGVATPGNALTRRLGWITKDPENAAALTYVCHGPPGIAMLQAGASKAQVCGRLMLRHEALVRSFHVFLLFPLGGTLRSSQGSGRAGRVRRAVLQLFRTLLLSVT